MILRTNSDARPEPKRPESLPKTLPGTVCVQWRTCGKLACRCARGEPHGPYHYRFWRERGRLRKAYVARHDVEEVRAACLCRRLIRTALKAGWSDFRRLVAVLKETTKP